MKISVIITLFVGLVACASGTLLKAPKSLLENCLKKGSTQFNETAPGRVQIQMCAGCCTACSPFFAGMAGGTLLHDPTDLLWNLCNEVGADPSGCDAAIAADTACVKQEIIEPPKNLLEICPLAGMYGGPGGGSPNLDCKRSSVVPYQSDEFKNFEPSILLDQVLPCQECCTVCRPILQATSAVEQQRFNASGLMGHTPKELTGQFILDEQKNTGYNLQAWAPCLMAGLSAPSCTATFARPPWETTMKGCCREYIPGAPKRKRYLNHHDTLFSTMDILGGSMADATATCKEACENANATLVPGLQVNAGECTAVEVHASKKTKKLKRNKNKRQKKTSKGFTCELHTENINSASRKSKTCKKAKCFTLGV